MPYKIGNFSSNLSEPYSCCSDTSVMAVFSFPLLQGGNAFSLNPSNTLAIRLYHCFCCKRTLRQERGNPLRKPLTWVYPASGYIFFLLSFFKNHRYFSILIKLFQINNLNSTPWPHLKLTLSLKQILKETVRYEELFLQHAHSLLQSSLFK